LGVFSGSAMFRLRMRVKSSDSEMGVVKEEDEEMQVQDEVKPEINPEIVLKTAEITSKTAKITPKTPEIKPEIAPITHQEVPPQSQPETLPEFTQTSSTPANNKKTTEIEDLQKLSEKYPELISEFVPFGGSSSNMKPKPTQQTTQNQFSTPENSQNQQHPSNQFSTDPQIVIYSKSEIEEQQSSKMSDEDDSFFEITIADIKLQQASLQQSSSNESMLMTKKMRENARIQKMNDFGHVKIRFEGPDNRYVLEAIFQSKNTIGEVKEKVKHVFPENSMPKMSMFIIPPKQILKDTDVLFDLGFYTRGKIFMKYENHLDFQFSDEILETFLKPFPVEKPVERAPQVKRVYQSSSISGSGNIARNNTESSSSPTKKKVPTWFKMK